MKTIDPAAFINMLSSGTTVIDTRSSSDFKKGFVPSAICLPLHKITEWAPGLISKTEPMILVTDAGKENESINTLKQCGFNHIEGCLAGGFEAWQAAGYPIDIIVDVQADELMIDIPFDDHLLVIDVRNPLEYADGHLKDSVNLPLNLLADPLTMAQLNDDDNLYLHCGGGASSVMAASLLKKHGFHNLHNVAGGWKKIKEEPRAEIIKEPQALS